MYVILMILIYDTALKGIKYNITIYLYLLLKINN